MENVSYTINETAEMLNLSAKTIRRYIKSGKLPSTKVPTKFGDEYRITEIPEELKKEAAAQAEIQSKVSVVPAENPDIKLDVQKLYQENLRMAAQMGMLAARIKQLEDQIKSQESQLIPAMERVKDLERQTLMLESLESKIKLLEAPKNNKPKVSWWKRMFGVNN
jgi:excisionase family DNA binding protein